MTLMSPITILPKLLPEFCNRHTLRLPLPRFRLEFLPALLGQHVLFRMPVILGRAPLALDQPLTLQAAESRKERASIYPEYSVADLLDSQPHPVSMQWFQGHRFQNEHVQRALHSSTRLL
jgi:hypothetical protein